MLSDAPAPVVRLAWRLTIGAALIYLATAGGSLVTKDAVVMFEQTRQLLDHGTFALPERVLGARQHVGTDGRSYSPFGIGQSIYNIPFFLAGRGLWASGLARSLPEDAVTKAAVALGATVASAAIVGLSFMTAWRLAGDASASMQAAFFVGFGTLVWPYSKFGFNAPLATLAVLSAVHFAHCAAVSNRTRTAALAGASLAAALLTRHELALVGIPVGLWWILQARAGRATWRPLTAFVAMWALGVVCWMAYNAIRFGSPWRAGYRPRFGSGGVLGLIVSPEGSMVAYMPIVVAGIYGVYVLFKRRHSVAILIATATLTMFAFYASLDDWLGTRSFGPRYLVVITPLLVAPTVVLLAGWSGAALRRATMVVGLASVMLQVPSVIVDFTKARVDTVAGDRHATYRAAERSWRDSSIARNVARAMEQLPPNLHYLTGRRDPPPTAAGAGLAQQFGYSLDLWWLYLFYMRVLSAPAALLAGLSPFIAGIWLIVAVSRDAGRSSCRTYGLMRWDLDYLEIYEPRERMVVGAADLALQAALLPARLLPARRRTPPRRILLLRLERIGDLLMSLGAIASVRALAPDATIDLIVGSWNEAIAKLIPGIDRVEVLDAPWLARDTPGQHSMELARRGLSWRSRHYGLSINFEGDIRSHTLPWLAGAARRVGFAMAGGGPLLTDVVAHNGTRHVAANSLALVERAFDLPVGTLPEPRSAEGLARSRLAIPESARAAARAALTQAAGGRLPSVLMALHVSGGRAIKQWPPSRFADAAAVLAQEMGAAVVLTGTPEDRPLVDEAEARLKMHGINSLRLEGHVDLIVSGGILSLSRLLLTGDTGPMHLAAAVGTPVLAVFGPSMPWRYGPLVDQHRIVRVDLTCSPCNRIRLPPERCRGRVPDCLDQVTTKAVIAAGRELLTSCGGGALAPRNASAEAPAS